MKHSIEIDGQKRDIDIRPMDEDFIVYRKMYAPPLTPENIGKVNPGDWAEHIELFRKKGWQLLIEDFLRKHIRAIGSCAILAWDGDGVIGKMYFTTQEMWDAFVEADCFFCIEHESMPKFIESLSDERIESLLASPSHTLRLLCSNIGHFDTRYHGKGIASALLEVLRSWAMEHGWRRITIKSCPDVVPFWAVGPNQVRQGPLERRGFHIVSESRVAPEQAEFRREAITRILTGQFKEDDWDVKTYPDNIASVKRIAETSAWEDVYDREYVMALDLH